MYFILNNFLFDGNLPSKAAEDVDLSLFSADQIKTDDRRENQESRNQIKHHKDGSLQI